MLNRKGAEIMIEIYAVQRDKALVIPVRTEQIERLITKYKRRVARLNKYLDRFMYLDAEGYIVF